MESYQRQIMQEKDKLLKKQFNLIVFLTVLFTIFFSRNIEAIEIAQKIEEYLKKLDLFSSAFIQSSGNDLEDGKIYSAHSELINKIPGKHNLQSQNKNAQI